MPWLSVRSRWPTPRPTRRGLCVSQIHIHPSQRNGARRPAAPVQEPTAVLGAALAGGVPPELQSPANRAVGAVIEFYGCSSVPEAAAALERARYSGVSERTDDFCPWCEHRVSGG